MITGQSGPDYGGCGSSSGLQPVQRMPKSAVRLPTYHLGSGGRILRAEVVPAADDAEARAFVRELAAAGPMELWERGRRIAIDPPGEAEPGRLG